MAITLISHNVQGFNSPNKRKKAFLQYNKLKAKIVMLQETHFMKDAHPTFFHKAYNQSFYTTSSSKTKGVAIFFHHSFPFEIQQVYKDHESRFIIIKGTLSGRELTVANVYAPNDAQTSFFTQFFNKLQQLHSSHIIVGGDFNSVMQPNLDRSKQNLSSKTLSKTTITHLNDLQLIDSWRALNIGAREYTFYSHPHDSYSRIDHIFCTPIILANTHDAAIHPCSWSDHQIVTLSTEFIGLTPTPYSWRLNESLLSDPVHQQEIASEIKDYFILNSNPDISPSTLWMAHKAVVRGHLIKRAAQCNRSKWEKIHSLTKDLQNLYKDHTRSHDPDTLKLISQKGTELDSLLTFRAEKALRWSKAKFFLSSNSYSTMFARKLNQTIKPTHVYKLKNSSNQLITHPQEILSIFKNFYSDLLSAPNSTIPLSSINWLDNLPFPKLTKTNIESLNAPCTEEELLQIIKSLKKNSAPGPDGFSSLYYKQYHQFLIPHLSKLFNNILKGDQFPEEMLLANMSLIPKPNKDHTLPQNYRPISVINNDLKIFSRLLANRLSAIIPTLISPYQSGFIQGRQITDNIRLVTNIIQDANIHSQPLLMLSLDINKAFDSVSWTFLDIVLKKYGFQGEFVHAFHALYHNPATRIRLPGCNSEFFKLGRGTRQGCPMSPLLFALAIEPLATAILSHTDIKGYSTKNGTYKLSMYADDMLLFLTQPNIALPNLLQTLNIFSSLSGLSVNVSKSIGMPINIPSAQLESLRSSFNFSWSMESLPYLGIFLTPNIKDIASKNYTSLLLKLRSTLRMWKPFNISFLGRITAVKMIILPKLLYMFRALPIRINKILITKFQSDIHKYIWADSHPRLSRSVLFKSHRDGGLGLPDF